MKLCQFIKRRSKLKTYGISLLFTLVLIQIRSNFQTARISKTEQIRDKLLQANREISQTENIPLARGNFKSKSKSVNLPKGSQVEIIATGKLKPKKDNSSSQQILEKQLVAGHLQKEAILVEKEIPDHYRAKRTIYKRKLDNGTDTSKTTNYVNKNCYLLIGVISSASNYGLRTLIRNQMRSNKLVVPSSNITINKTFWNFAKEDHRSKFQVKVIFVCGISPNLTAHKHVLQEKELYNDVIIGDFLDTYYNLTLKSMFLLSHFTQYYPNAKFLLKIDDNVRLHLQLLLQRLWQYENTNIIIGHILRHFPPVRNESSKWYVSEETYPNQTYPLYAAGPAYIISDVAARNILRVCGAIKTPFYIEDVFVTGMCRVKAGIRFKHEKNICYEEHNKDILCAVEHRRETKFLLKLSSQLAIE